VAINVTFNNISQANSEILKAFNSAKADGATLQAMLNLLSAKMI